MKPSRKASRSGWKTINVRAFHRELNLLPAAIRSIALDLLDEFKIDAEAATAASKGVRLREHSNTSRIRFGESFHHKGYRLIYDMYPHSRKVVLLAVGSRPTVYAGVPGSGQKKTR